MEFIGRNYHQLAPQVYRAIEQHGVAMNSRNGPVKRLPGTVTLVVKRPWERVNVSPVRNANPFFHLVEAMAMLNGNNSVQLLSYFAKNMENYSDDGSTYNAFYGTRLRWTWGDQIDQIIQELTDDPDSRRCVAQIWDPADLWRTTKDKACNLLLMFSINPEGALEMTSVNRSNDAIWGILTGANIVHLPFFQEYVACALGRAMGPWTHITNNLHVYTENPQWHLMLNAPECDMYESYAGGVASPRLFAGPASRGTFDTMLDIAMTQMIWSLQTGIPAGLGDKLFDGALFVQKVLAPVYHLWWGWKHRLPLSVLRNSYTEIKADDWALACSNWIERAYPKREGAQ